jgi:Outer membrane protein Omp28
MLFTRKNILWAVALLLAGCREKPILIPDLKVGESRILVEELTGVRCGNCPDGTKELIELRKRFNERVIIVAIHAAPGFDTPFPESTQDFRTPKGTQLANFIGQAAFYPCAAINRRLVPPEQELYLSRPIWAGLITEALAKPPATGLFANTNFNAANRQLNAEIRIAPEQALSGEHRLTVLMTEDSIVDVQRVIVDKVANYQQRFVLRDILTAPTGDAIGEPLTPANVLVRNFTTTLPAKWNERRCRLVAFLHRNTPNSKDVIQAVEVRVVK